MNHFINENKYPDIDKRRKRCYTFSKWAFSQFYYLPISFWAYSILKDTSFMPHWLGGNGSCINLEAYMYTFDQATTQMKIFYIIQFGKHISRFFTHVFIRAQGNFFEYALHHGLSSFLILFSYLSNMWLIGVMVLMLHDISDFALINVRAYRDFKYRKEWFLNCMDIMSMPLWLGCRIFIFGYCCVFSSLKTVFNIHMFDLLVEPHKYVLFWPYVFMSLMLIGLQVLQIFWTYYIASSFVSVNITAKVKHTYD